MKNILVPIGSNDTAVGNLQYAIDLAYHVDAYVYVFSAFRELSKVGGLAKVNTIIKEDCENRLQEVLDKVDKKGITVIAHPIKGSVLETLVRFNKYVPIDLMVLSPRSNSIREEVYLGKTTGNLIKNTNIPALIVPEGDVFKGPESILMAFKDGNFKYKATLKPLKSFLIHFGSEIKLLHVTTPECSPEMQRVSKKLQKLQTSYIKSENASTFQGVLEHFQSHDPDMVCVIRRKRGFFKKLWGKNVVPKKEFHTSKPLLVLSNQQ
jgi:nucleotide-binding universal stress UspA family protein